MPPNSAGIAPCRSRPMSSIESAPAAIPATRHGTFRCALTPHSPAGRTGPAARSGSPARCARAITGTRPACDTRFGSSNDACVFARLCNNRTWQVPSRTRRRKRETLPSSQVRGHLLRLTRPKAPNLPVNRGSVGTVSKRCTWSRYSVGAPLSMGPADGGEEQYRGHHDAHHHDAHGPVPARYAHPRVRLVARRHRGYVSCGGAESGVTGLVAVGVRRRSRPAAAAPPHPMVAKTKVVKPSRTMLLPIRSL